MHNGKLTEHEKLEIAEYVVELLTTALTEHGPYDSKLGEWMRHAKGECIMRLGGYLKSYNKLGR